MSNINLRKTTDDLNGIPDGSLVVKTAGAPSALTGTVSRQIAEWSGTTWAAVTAPLFLLANGARSAQIPDNTATGGNARGENAVDFQVARTLATNVASGIRSLIGNGNRNTASGLESAVVNGFVNTASGDRAFVGGGAANNASGSASVIVGGENNTASGHYGWIPGGARAVTRAIRGVHAWSSASRLVDGDNQHWGIILHRETTDATPTILTSDRVAPSTTNVMVLPNNGSWSGIVDVQARDTSGNTAKWTISLLAKRGANAAATSIVDQHVIRTFAEAALSTAAVTIVPNGTRGSWEIQVTGIAATTIDWIADVTVGSLTHR